MFTQPDNHTFHKALGGGRHAQMLLCRPFGLEAVSLLAEQPMSASDLESELLGVGRSAIDRYVAELTWAGAITHQPRPRAGRTRDLILTDYGQELPVLGTQFEDWFTHWPGDGTMTFAGELGQRTIQSRAEGWGPVILWEAGGKPRSMSWFELHVGAEAWGLDSVEAIRQRVRWMEETGQIEVVDPTARPKLYRPTRWSYLGTGCLAYAITAEIYHRPPNCKPPSVRVIAFGLVQAGHVIQAAEDVSGVIQVVIPVEGRKKPIEIHYEVDHGRMKAWGWGRAENPTATGEGELIRWLGPMAGLPVRPPSITGDRVFFDGVLAGVKQGFFAPNPN